MKFLFFIPMLALLVSNTPLQVELPLPEAEAECMMAENTACYPGEEMPEKEDGCCRGREATCTVVCWSPLVAQDQQDTGFLIEMMVTQLPAGEYRQPRWSTPYIAGPTQPPDAA